MQEAPENGKELSHSAHANGVNEWMNWCNISEDLYLHEHHCGNLRSYVDGVCNVSLMFLPLMCSYNTWVYIGQMDCESGKPVHKTVTVIISLCINLIKMHPWRFLYHRQLDVSWMRQNLDFEKKLFELWTNQEDLQESYSCRNEETLPRLTMQSQHTSFALLHLSYMEHCSLTDTLCYFIFCKCFRIWPYMVRYVN